MSPQAARESSIFWFYVGLALALLILAGVVLAVLKWGFRKDVEHAWRSYRGWLILAPAAFGCIFLGRVTAIVSVTVVAISGFREFGRATGLYRDWMMTGAVYVGVLAAGTVSIIRDPADGNPGWYGLFMALPVFVIAMILIVPILRNRAQGQLQALSLAIVGFIYFGWMFGHLAFLANSSHAYGYLLYLLVGVELNDVAAYICGKLFGRNKLRSNISPKKTWEGSLGALAFSMLLPWIMHFALPHFGATECILAGLILGIGGQLGDLALSVIKRDVGIKDMGSAIPGHGGFLDRIDSLVYVAPLFFHMTRFFHDLY
ncbi:MAG: phosphatidate cytidylyltransferase [Gemmataceae bacterium]